jgi:hypothetical protein
MVDITIQYIPCMLWLLLLSSHLQDKQYNLLSLLMVGMFQLRKVHIVSGLSLVKNQLHTWQNTFVEMY